MSDLEKRLDSIEAKIDNINNFVNNFNDVIEKHRDTYHESSDWESSDKKIDEIYDFLRTIVPDKPHHHNYEDDYEDYDEDYIPPYMDNVKKTTLDSMEEYSKNYEKEKK